MGQKVLIDPVTRIEGHLAISLEVENGRVGEARCAGEMFRGFETILRGRHPLDAQQITQRICGVCPIAHGMSSILAQDMAYQVTPPDNGRLLRNLIQGANYLQSHILHFYLLSALDFIDIAAITKYQGKDSQLNGLKGWVETQLASNALYPAAPFLPRYEGQYVTDTETNLTAVKHYLEALQFRTLAHATAALFCGKIPHATALVPGGVTEQASVDKLTAYGANLRRLRSFIEDGYIPDLLAVAGAFPEYLTLGKGCGNFLVYGAFHETPDGKGALFPSGVLLKGELSNLDPAGITEDVRYSLYSSPSGLHPSRGELQAAPDKQEGYSWIKAPRYQGQAMEVGALARLLVGYRRGAPVIKNAMDAFLAKTGLVLEQLDSVLGRHAARAIESKIVADRCLAWLEQVKPGAPTFQTFDIPLEAEGYGLHEAPRGALGHWISIKEGKIANYQCVVPTTWNASPRDDRGNSGPIEQALVGTPVANPDHPLEAARVVRSFDPCIACAVH